MKIPQNLKKTEFDGRKALIIGDHPFSKKIAVCIGAFKGALGWYLAFEELKTKERFEVLQPSNVTWIQEYRNEN